jgi:hypothetical protein
MLPLHREKSDGVENRNKTRPECAEVRTVSAPEIITAFAVSTVGFSVFLFGKKQQRVPQLVTGMLLMVAPVVVSAPIWLTVTAVGLLFGMRVAIHHET